MNTSLFQHLSTFAVSRTASHTGLSGIFHRAQQPEYVQALIVIRRLLGRITLAFLCVTLPTLALVAANTHPLPEPSSIQQLGTRVADWQLKQLGYLPGSKPLPKPKSHAKAWEIATFWVGLSYFADLTDSPAYKSALIEQGRRNDWQLGPWLEFADDHAIGQSYLWAVNNGAKESALMPMRKSFDKILANPPQVHLSFYFGEKGYGSAECLVRWCWCDALFMSPPAMIGLSRETGDPRYANYAFAEFWATTDFLYDPAEQLFFRDSRFFQLRDTNERKLFWSRGNGWVFAGLANILRLLPPDHPERAKFTQLFSEMANRLITLQGSNGYWPPSLLAPEGAPPESSGTSFFTYGLAYGVNAGILKQATFMPAVLAGWKALEKSVNSEGRLGWVQQVSDRPDVVKESDTHYYGVGAFLLAASEVAKLSPKPASK